jgi:hypothetical protein
MAGFIDAQEAAILETFFSVNLYLALSSTTPTDAGANFTEPVAGAYGRVLTVPANWAAAIAGNPTTKANGVAFAFPQATAQWSAGALFTHWGLFLGAAGGTVQFWAPLTTPFAVNINQIPVCAIGSLIAKLGDPGDSY